jgi:hypothetical protein
MTKAEKKKKVMVLARKAGFYISYNLLDRPKGLLYFRGSRPVTLKAALNISILKWSIISALAENGNFLEDGARSTCGLCMYAGDFCVSCPIYEKTGYRDCANTPYQEWSHNINDAKKALQAAREELRFLKSLKV